MAIIIITAIVGIIIFCLPFIVKSWIRNKFISNDPQSTLFSSPIYWRAGLYFMIISFLYSAVIVNLGERLVSLPTYLYAIIISLIIALFTELGRFFILDKLIKVREKNHLIEFGLGYLSVSTIITGLFMIFNSFICFYFAGNPDLSADFSSLGKAEFTNIEILQEIALRYLAQNPLIAFVPLVEKFAELFLSVYLSFLIAFGIQSGRQIKVWQAVLIKVTFLFLLFLKPFGDNINLNEFFASLIYIGTGIFIYSQIKRKLA